MYDTAVKGVEAYLLKTSRGGLKYLGEYKNGRTEAKMGHLTCFAGMVVSRICLVVQLFKVLVARHSDESGRNRA